LLVLPHWLVLAPLHMLLAKIMGIRVKPPSSRVTGVAAGQGGDGLLQGHAVLALKGSTWIRSTEIVGLRKQD
jgi:hypothetical protein